MGLKFWHLLVVAGLALALVVAGLLVWLIIHLSRQSQAKPSGFDTYADKLQAVQNPDTLRIQNSSAAALQDPLRTILRWVLIGVLMARFAVPFIMAIFRWLGFSNDIFTTFDYLLIAVLATGSGYLAFTTKSTPEDARIRAVTFLIIAPSALQVIMHPIATLLGYMFGPIFSAIPNGLGLLAGFACAIIALVKLTKLTKH